MIKKFVFNRRKKDTIILLHGLYTNSGFWLSYLNQFKNFKIVVFDLDYEKILRDKTFSKNAFKVDENVVAIISHSFGTVISDLVFEKENAIVHKICPVAFSKRITTNNFVSDIVCKTRYTEDSITHLIKLVSAFMTEESSLLNLNGQIYIPTKDCYFSYNIPEKIKIEFLGDHFNINIALEMILENLPLRDEIESQELITNKNTFK